MSEDVNGINPLRNVRGIIDFTYIYVGGSSDMDIAFNTYSVHKQHHLIKLLTIILPDGSWWNPLGVFYVNKGNSDSKVLDYCVTNNSCNIKQSFDLDRYVHAYIFDFDDVFGLQLICTHA